MSLLRFFGKNISTSCVISFCIFAPLNCSTQHSVPWILFISLFVEGTLNLLWGLSLTNSNSSKPEVIAMIWEHWISMDTRYKSLSCEKASLVSLLSLLLLIYWSWFFKCWLQVCFCTCQFTNMGDECRSNSWTGHFISYFWQRANWCLPWLVWIIQHLPTILWSSTFQFPVQKLDKEEVHLKMLSLPFFWLKQR